MDSKAPSKTMRKKKNKIRSSNLIVLTARGAFVVVAASLTRAPSIQNSNTIQFTNSKYSPISIGRYW